MSLEAKHTATPWKQFDQTADFNKYDVRHNGGALIATTSGNQSIPAEERAANAAYIILAVNAHADLVASIECEQALRDLERLDSTDPKFEEALETFNKHGRNGAGIPGFLDALRHKALDTLRGV